MWKTVIAVLCLILLVSSILLYFLLFRESTTEDLPLCLFNPDDYPRVETLIPCSNQRYYDTKGDRTVAIMSPDIAPLASQICKEWCSQLQLPNTCLAESQSYVKCLTELQPTTCIARAIPVATTGNDYAFVIGRGNLCF